MASQSYIIAGEDRMIALIKPVQDLMAAWSRETWSADIGGLPYPENADCWRTLAINARQLAIKLQNLAKLIESPIQST